MRYLIILLFFVGCSAYPENTSYTFPSVGWSINIPAGYIAEDSTTQYGKMKRTPVYQHSLDTTEHWLLYVHDTTGWNQTKYSLNAVWRYCPDTTYMQAYLNKVHGPFLSQGKFSADSGTLHISDRLFNSYRFTIQRDGKTEIFVSYHSMEGGKLFSTLINYYDTDTLGSRLVPIFEKSVFR